MNDDTFPAAPSAEPRHPIRVVCRRTGLKADVIRVWERRYGAVVPFRSSSRHRLYSDADIERLRLLRLAVEGGRRIRLVADSSVEDLRELVRQDAAEASNKSPSRAFDPSGSGAADELVEDALRATLALDDLGLSRVLDDAAVRLSRIGLLEQFVVPFMERIGNLWREGTLRPVHEHLATARLRSFVGRWRSPSGPSNSPVLLVTTPQGQRHELGALAAAVCAATEGWSVTYLGPDLPAEEIVAGVLQVEADALALSLTFPADDSALPGEIARVRELLPEEVALLVGGRALSAYEASLPRTGLLPLPSLRAFRDELSALRERIPPKAKGA